MTLRFPCFDAQFSLFPFCSSHFSPYSLFNAKSCTFIIPCLLVSAEFGQHDINSLPSASLLFLSLSNNKKQTDLLTNLTRKAFVFQKRKTPHSPFPESDTMSYKLCDDIIKHTLKAHASGYKPEEIHDQLLKRGYTRLPLSAVKDCLLQNGHVIDGYGATEDNTPSFSAYALPPLEKPWDAEADTFAYNSYELGKSVRWTWWNLRSKGYNVTEAEVITSLESKGVQGWGITE